MPFDIDARLAEWRKCLLDTSKRNRLIKFAAGRIGGVTLLYPPPAALWDRLVREGEQVTFTWKRELLGLPPEVLDAETLADFDPRGGIAADDDVAREFSRLCLRSPRLRPEHALTDFTDAALVARLTRLVRTAQEAETDHGVTTLFAAFGFLRWFESPDSDEELLSPLLLVPVRLGRETVESEFTLEAAEDEILPNHCLAELLQSQFRIKLPTAVEAPLDPENPECLANYLKAVDGKVAHVPRWGAVEAAALGVFNFQKLAMWEDLGRNADRVKAHPLCRAVAGDRSALEKPPADLPAAADLDRVVPPENAFHILDADSSQHEAIEAVKRGAHLVMDGPPGTGKSQTIANMIAETLAAGKTVLFVSEKTAALEVVKRRLDKCGLGDFCLELHSHKASKKEVVAELGRCLDLPPAGLPDTTERLKELAETRRKLNEFVAELHAPRPPLGWSAFRVHGELSRIDRVPGRSRLAIPDVFTKDAEYVRRGSEILAGLADSRAVLEETGGHPWRGCKLTTYTHAAADEAKFSLTRLANCVPAAEKAAGELATAGLCDVSTNRSWAKAEADAHRVLLLPLFPSAWFQGEARTVAEAVVELDRATRDARDLAGKLPEFDPKAVRELSNVAMGPAASSPSPLAGEGSREPASDRVRGERLRETPHPVQSAAHLEPPSPARGEGETPGDLRKGMESLSTSSARERLVAGATLTARGRLEAFARVGPALRKARELAGGVEKVGREVATYLRLPVPPPFGQLGELTSLAERIAKAPAIPESWWNPARRPELVTAFARAADEERAAQELRTRLVAKFSPAALAPEASALAREAASAAGSIWRWLPWSRWAKVRKQVEAWYPAGAPDGATVRADVAELAKHHRHADAARQVAAAYPGEHFPGAAGKPDWAATLTGLKDIERLEQWKAAGSNPDREKLRATAANLAQATAAFQDGWGSLLRDLAVPDPAAVLAQPSPEVVAWLEAEAVAVEAEAAALTRIVGLLAAGRDVAAGDLRRRVTDLCHLIEARGRIATAAKVLNDTRSPEAIEAADHAKDAELARSLLGFLAEWGKSVSPALATALSDATARERLKTAVTHSEAARREFAKPWDVIATDLFDVEARVSTDVVLNDVPLPDLKTWATARAADADRLAEWAQFVKVERDAAAFGITPVLDEVKAGEFPAASAADAFRARFYRLWLDALQQQAPTLAAFATDTHERLASRFAELDRLAVRTAADRVRGALLANPNRPRSRDGAPESSELGLLLREANKKRRHLPLRNLFRQIPAILPRLKPCLMMSPLAVSTYLDSPDIEFDLVVFDEASQVRPHDAVCALYRGRQFVVGGDPKQLPPTDFFTRTTEDGEETESDAAGFESLLDVCLSLGLTRKRLRWHYRSRREGLIAFSNRFFYDGRLITFPSADEATTRAVAFVKVADGRFKDGVNVVEARRVAALVMDHARESSDRSLGVIAFSQRQQDRILDELEVLRRQNLDLEPFFDDGRADPFFVKNLENVQGDERDAIFLSVGYGPDDAGKVAMRFGPLNRAGGERRLNVAVTRARWAMTVVASMTAADVDLSRTGAEGAKLLKVFLDYADRGPASLAEAITEADAHTADSPFEQEVGNELAHRGLTTHRQVGCGGYRIDLAIVDPQQGGKYLLGVECDGATYHAAATARDRDRLRQAVLEGLGWRLVRVWSSDWVRDRDKQVRRVLAALDAAKKPAPQTPEPERLPVVKPHTAKAKPPQYEDIEAVPEPALTDAVTSVLADFGSMLFEELSPAVAKRLGFKRTGPKIRERVVTALNFLTASGRAMVEGEDVNRRVRLIAAR